VVELALATGLSRPRVQTLLSEAKARGEVVDEGIGPKLWRLA
jgi:DNA-binding transcriptional regulator LsrR (DeoR family)